MESRTGIRWILLVCAAGLAAVGGCKKQPSVNSPQPASSASTQSDGQPRPATAQENPQPESGAEPAHTGVRWYTNFEEALAAAQKENKDLLINFSGSDWCIFCIRLEKDVFAQEAFAKEAEKYFVFMLVDFPNDPSKQSEEIRKQNQQLARRYRFRNLFPTLYLAKPDGTPYAMAEYQPLGPTEYLDYLLKIRRYRDR
ncbi:MAG TPA: thioredoxin family protein [Anaerohalosphaeraceae bacterium]|nr:thioredoxin family protein [Anaerohalosphaeraceae bacterium]